MPHNDRPPEAPPVHQSFENARDDVRHSKPAENPDRERHGIPTRAGLEILEKPPVPVMEHNIEGSTRRMVDEDVKAENDHKAAYYRKSLQKAQNLETQKKFNNKARDSKVQRDFHRSSGFDR